MDLEIHTAAVTIRTDHIEAAERGNLLALSDTTPCAKREGLGLSAIL
jgi:hypothetical protein